MSKYGKKIRSKKDKPIYKHDCSNCKFIKHIYMEGAVQGTRMKSHDIYFCRGSVSALDTWVIRYSNEPGSYWSMDEATLLRDPEHIGSTFFQEARKEARKLVIRRRKNGS